MEPEQVTPKTEVVDLTTVQAFGPNGCIHDWQKKPSTEIRHATEFVCKKCHWGFLQRAN